MLVICRRANQGFWIGSYHVVIVEVKHGKKVVLGIEAPKDVIVLRDELVGRKPLPAKG